MTKTRVLPILLCVMIMVTSLPFMAFADDSTFYDTIKDVVGYEYLEVQKAYDMTSVTTVDEFKSKYGVSKASAATTFDAVNGASFNNSGYFQLSQGSGWSPVAEGRVAAFTAKTTGDFWAAWTAPDGVTYGAVFVTSSGVKKAMGELSYVNSAYAPGDDWSDYLVVGDTETAWSFYMKNAATNDKYVLMAQGGYAGNGATGYGLYLGDYGYVKNVTIYGKKTEEGFDSIDEVVGKAMYEEKAYDMTSVTSVDEFKSKYSITTASASLTFDAENGATLGGGYFRLTQNAGWSPVAEGRVVTFTSKVADGGTWAAWTAPDGDAYGTVIIHADKIVTGESIELTYANTTYAPGNDYVDYLVVGDSDTTWSFYMKNAATNDKYVLMAKGGYSKTGRGSYGLMLGDYGYVKNATIYSDIQPEGGGSGEGGGESGGETPTPPPSGDESFNSIRGIVGRNLIVENRFDMRKDNFTGVSGFDASAEPTYDANVGMSLNNGDWKYRPQDGYTPITVGDKVTFFRGKVDSANNGLYVFFPGPANSSDRAGICIKTNGLSMNEGSSTYYNSSFVPGSDWTDYLLVAESDTIWILYGKNDSTNYRWKAIMKGTYGQRGSAKTGFWFFGYGYIKDAAIYKNGTLGSVGSKATSEELFGSALLDTNKKLIFDNSFDGTTENAGAKNVESDTDITPYNIGENGLELVNTGVNEYFAWNYGANNSWNPLGVRTPILFRAKMSEGGQLGVRIGGGSMVNILLTPSSVKVDGILGEKSTYAPGTEWVNYLVLTDGAKVSLYAKSDTETDWTLTAEPELFDLGGYYGVLLNNTSGATTYVSEISQGVLSNPVLTDHEKIAALSGSLYLNEVNPQGTYDMTNIDPRGTWYIRVKATITGGEGVSGSVRNNGKQIDWKLTSTELSVGAGDSTMTKGYVAPTGVQHEILFVYNFNASVSVYFYNGADGTWAKTHTDIATAAAAGVDDISFEEAVGNVDEVQIYSGDLFAAKTSLGGGNFCIVGEYLSGTIEDLFRRRATVIAVAYDKEYGYTTFAAPLEYEEESGNVIRINENIPGASITTAENDLSAVIWDTLEDGIALADGVGVMVVNKATGKPESNQKPGLVLEERFNSVRITGYTGGSLVPVVASLVDTEGVIRGIAQTRANADGMVDAEVAVDPDLPNGIYTVMAQYGSAGAITRRVNLCGENIPYQSITSEQDMKNFLANYGSVKVQKWNQDTDFAKDVLNRFEELKGNTTSFSNLYDFRVFMDPALDGEVRERDLCKGVNDASKARRWNDIQRLLMETYAADLGITQADIAGIDDVKSLFLRIGSDYTNNSEVLAGFRAAVTAQRNEEAGGFGGVGGFGGGAGGSGGAGGGMVGSNASADSVFNNVAVNGGGVVGGSAPMVEGTNEFTDLDSVSWAESSIKRLQALKIVSGDGSGNFYPNNAVTREEFLKMAMRATGIQTTTNVPLSFGDVAMDEWYYPYVAAAYDAGIINGISDECFGIGQQITRADMAVILKRILDYKGIEVIGIKAAFVFDDFDTIPVYARESVTRLSEAGLMNGVGKNTFQGAASATRAESAVAILRIYNYITERR